MSSGIHPLKPCRGGSAGCTRQGIGCGELKAALRFCAAPGCSSRVKAGHCPTHTTEHRKLRLLSQDPRYRSTRWTKLARQVTADDPFCQCGMVTEHAGHIIPGFMLKDDASFYHRANLRGQCRQCNAKQAAEDAATYKGQPRYSIVFKNETVLALG